MDAGVKRGVVVGGVGGHGGGCCGRATGAMATTTVTLRCAGRDRRTVSGRELPRTRVASRDRIEESRVLRRCRAGRPATAGCLGGEGLLGGLVGEFGPEEGCELASDRDGHDGRALAALGEVAVAVVQADLGLPGAVGGVWASGGSAGCVAVVPGGFDEQSAGVAVAGFGDVAAVLLVAAAVFAGGDAQPGASSRGWLKRRSRRSRRSGPARSGSGCRGTRAAGRPASAQRSSVGDLLQAGVERGELAVDSVEVDQHLLQREWASGSSRRWRATHARWLESRP